MVVEFESQCRQFIILLLMCFFFFVKLLGVLNGHVHNGRCLLSHTISELILIKVGMVHKSGKALSQNTTAFSGFELETTG